MTWAKYLHTLKVDIRLEYGPWSGHKNCPFHFVYHKEVCNHRILVSQKLIYKTYMYNQYVHQKEIAKRDIFSETFSWNKIPLAVVAVEERSKSCNWQNLQPNSVRVGANCSQRPINQLSCELHDKSMRTGS